MAGFCPLLLLRGEWGGWAGPPLAPPTLPPVLYHHPSYRYKHEGLVKHSYNWNYIMGLFNISFNISDKNGL